MNPFEFSLGALIVIFAFVLLRQKMGLSERSAEPVEDRAAAQENLRLHRQVEQLQERIHVLERIVTDSGVQTAAQIEALRDKARIPEEDKA